MGPGTTVYEHVGVLGPTVLGTAPDQHTPNPFQRRLLAALALDVAHGMSPEQLLGFLWEQQPPATARQSLHNHIRRARRSLVEDAVLWDGSRYRLNVDRVSLDAHISEARLARAEAAVAAQNPTQTLRYAQSALALWRGEPYADLDAEDVHPERARLAEVRAGLLEMRVGALLDLGRIASAISELEGLVAEDPHRETRWTQLVTALHRAGRRSDALEAYQRARDRLREDLGLEPSEELQTAQRQVLAGARRPPTDAATQPAGFLVGREDLVAEVVALLDETRSAVLTGPAGIGKTALGGRVVERLQATGQYAVTMSCADNPWTALQPIHELLESLRGEIARLDPPPAPAVLRVLDPDTQTVSRTASQTIADRRPPRGDAAGLVDDIVDALARIAGRVGPLVVAMDDADRCGPTTRRILVAALDRSADIRLLLMARNAHDLAGLADRALEVAVPGLDETEVRELVEHEIETRADCTEFVSWLTGLTAGNPLFVHALLDDLRARDALRPVEGELEPPEAFDVPAELLDVMKRRIAGLGLATRRTLDVAAVIGPDIDEDLLARMTDPDDLHAAVVAGLLERREGGLAFVHDLLHRAAYELIPPGRRAELHDTAATIERERNGAAVTIAEHASAARELDPVGAAHATEEAGRASLAMQAYDEAVAWFERAREALVAAGVTELTRLLELAVEAADARRLAGLPGHAENLLDCAEQAVVSGDDDLRRRAVLAALALGETSETGEAGPIHRRAADLAEQALERESDPAAAAAISAAASLVHSMVDEADRCRELYEQAERHLARVPEDDYGATAVLVFPYAYLALGHADDLERREVAATRLRTVATQLDDRPGLFEAGHLTFSNALQRADGETLRATHVEMGQLLTRAGDAGRRWSHAYQEATLAALEGRFEDAEQASEEALRIGSGVVADRALAVYGAQLLELRRLQGRLDELAPLFDDLVDGQPLVPAWRAAAALVSAGIDADRSRRHFDDLARDRFAAVPRDFAWLAAIQSAARAAVALEDRDRAGQAAEVLAPYEHLVCWQGSCTFGPVATTLAEIELLRGAPEDALPLATTARNIARSLDAPVYVEEAEALLGAGSPHPT